VATRALLGFGNGDEAARDSRHPTDHRDLKRILAGATLGLEPGVDFVQLGTHTQKVQSLSESEFTDTLRIRVLASVQMPDEPDEDVHPRGHVYLQREIADKNSAAVVDIRTTASRAARPATATTSACRWSPARRASRASSCTTRAARTPSARSATYRDLRPDGSLVYTSTAIGEPARLCRERARIGVTYTR